MTHRYKGEIQNKSLSGEVLHPIHRGGKSKKHIQYVILYYLCVMVYTTLSLFCFYCFSGVHAWRLL